MERVHAKHVGVYGVIRMENKLLLIKKNRGPYTGLYDLPGGSLEFGESIEEGLARELEEEIGGKVKTMQFLKNVTYMADWIHHDIPTSTYHIGMYYTVELEDLSQIKTDPDGHDSDGALWVAMEEINEGNISPIGWKVVKGVGR